MRDKEVKGKNFFAVQEHPKIFFASKSIASDGGPAKFHMDGELTMRGVTQPVSVTITLLPQDDGHEWIDGSFSFNRRDFGMTHNVPLDKIANTVLVQFHLDAVNGSPAASSEMSATAFQPPNFCCEITCLTPYPFEAYSCSSGFAGWIGGVGGVFRKIDCGHLQFR